MVCLPDGISAFPRSCLPLFPVASQCLPTIYVCVGWCVRLPKVLSRLVSSIVSHLPSCFPFLDGVPAFSRSCLPGLHVSPIVPHSLPLSPHMCACGGLVSPSLPLSPLSPIVCPHLCRLFDVLSSLLSPHMCACVGWGLVLSACVGRCVRLLEVLSPLVSHMCACDGWCLSLGWCVRLPAVLSPRVCLCWMVCPPSRGLVSPCLPSPFLFPFVGWCVRLLDVLSLVSHCLLTCEPV